MKHLLLVLMVFITISVFAQVPNNMSYQSVVRNNNGALITNTEIAVQISVLKGSRDGESVYIETHRTSTNANGLASFEIGGGDAIQGNFKTIDWKTGTYFIKTATDIKGGNNYNIVGVSELLSVPYALHSREAENTFSGNYDDLLKKPIYVSEFINDAGYITDPSLNTSGQKNAPGVPSQNWSLFGNSNTDPAKDKLGTTDSVDLIMVTNNKPRLVIQGNGDINISRSLEIGENLRVNRNVDLNILGGSTRNNGDFTVTSGSATLLTGTLTVDGTTDLNSSLDVNNASPTHLSGTLDVDLTLNVDGATDLNSSLDVNNASPTHLSGTLDVDSNLNVDGTTDLNSSLDVNNAAPTHLSGTLTAEGVTTINDILKVTTSKAVVANTSFDSYVANFVNTTNANGILIKVPAATPANANNFVTFVNSSNAVVGRIEGETLSELTTNIEYIMDKGALDVAVVMASINTATAVMAAILSDADVLAASTSSTVCGGAGACVTAPIPSLIAATVANAILINADAIVVAVGLADAIAQLDFFVTNKAANIGVTYQSGSGDYAEWLPKANATEKFIPGYVVGMKNGKISLNTEGADKLFAISTKPIVLGNMPQAGEEHAYEKVAFMGQVPVHVIGKVNAGDYILPSGFNNGFAKAVAPADMTAEDYAKIVGMAWSSGDNDSYNVINVAIGLNTGDISKLVAEQSKEIETLKKMNSETNAILAKLVPGFKEAAGIKDNAIAYEAVTSNNNLAHTNTAVHNDVNFVTPDASNIVYWEVTNDQIQDGMVLAEKMFVESGGDVNTHPFWSRIKSDSSYKEIVVNAFTTKMKNSIHTHKEINSKY